MYYSRCLLALEEDCVQACGVLANCTGYHVFTEACDGSDPGNCWVNSDAGSSSTLQARLIGLGFPPSRCIDDAGSGVASTTDRATCKRCMAKIRGPTAPLTPAPTNPP